MEEIHKNKISLEELYMSKIDINDKRDKNAWENKDFDKTAIIQ
jgi:hypothetical protein